MVDWKIWKNVIGSKDIARRRPRMWKAVEDIKTSAWEVKIRTGKACHEDDERDNGSARGKDSTIVGSSVFTLLASDRVSVAGLEDTDGVICLRPDENLGLLLDRQHRHRHRLRHRRCRLNTTLRSSWSAGRKAFVDDGPGDSIGCDASEGIQHSGRLRNLRKDGRFVHRHTRCVL